MGEIIQGEESNTAGIFTPLNVWKINSHLRFHQSNHPTVRKITVKLSTFSFLDLQLQSHFPRFHEIEFNARKDSSKIAIELDAIVKKYLCIHHQQTPRAYLKWLRSSCQLLTTSRIRSPNMTTKGVVWIHGTYNTRSFCHSIAFKYYTTKAAVEQLHLILQKLEGIWNNIIVS